jgi:uncharacterized protein (TIGR03083 family)
MPAATPPEPPELLGALDTVDLLREVDGRLGPLLRGLQAEDWDRPAVGHWTVRDVVAHLLDTALRRLSLDRDGHRPPVGDRDLSNWRELVDFLNELNAVWTRAAERLSPAVLVDLLEWANPRVADYFASLDPLAEAAFPVAWAGEASSRVWMDVAREYTERWHHQQQIREAVGAPWLDEPRYVVPLLDTFVRALPRAYAEAEAAAGTRIRVRVTDLEPCAWLLVREAVGDERAWALYRDAKQSAENAASATIALPAETAWRLFGKGLTADAAREQATVDGPEALTAPFFGAVAVMA